MVPVDHVGTLDPWDFGAVLDRSTPNSEPQVEVESYVKLYFRSRLYSCPIRWSTPHVSHTGSAGHGIGRDADVDVGHRGPRRRAASTASAARTFTAHLGGLPEADLRSGARGGATTPWSVDLDRRGARRDEPGEPGRRRGAPSRGAIVPPTPVTIFTPSSWGRPTGGSATVSTTRPLPSTTALPVGPSHPRHRPCARAP